MPNALMRLLVVLGALWTLPNTLLGLALGAIGLTRGARARWRRHDLALVFDRWPWGPGGAITFGNVLDKNSAVYKAKLREGEYLLLGELNTKPRTSYLPRVRNPNPELA